MVIQVTEIWLIILKKKISEKTLSINSCPNFISNFISLFNEIINNFNFDNIISNKKIISNIYDAKIYI